MKESDRMRRTKARGERLLFALFLILMGLSYLSIAGALLAIQ